MSSESRNEIVERFLHLVKPIAISLARRLPASFEIDDLVQWGTFGLMDAADRHDSTREATFEQYCRQKIRGAILSHCRREFRFATCEAIDDHVYELRASEPLPDELLQQEQEQEQTLEQLAVAVQALTPRQQQIIVMRFQCEQTQAEAGANLGGISQAGARDLEGRALEAMRKRLAPVVDFPKARTRRKQKFMGAPL